MLETQRRLYDTGIFSSVNVAIQNPEGSLADKNVLVQVELPKSAPDLADEEEKTWPAALDAAIKELKEKSEEVKRAAD